MELKSEILRTLVSGLDDWDKDASFNKQAEHLAAWITENVEEVAPRRYIPDAAICFFLDGDKWCCVFGDFVDLQESPAGFGDTFDEALVELQKQHRG